MEGRVAELEEKMTEMGKKQVEVDTKMDIQMGGKQPQI